MLETDLVKLAEREVIESARKWAQVYATQSAGHPYHEKVLLEAVTLLNARQAMKATEHLDPPEAI